MNFELRSALASCQLPPLRVHGGRPVELPNAGHLGGGQRALELVRRHQQQVLARALNQQRYPAYYRDMAVCLSAGMRPRDVLALCAQNSIEFAVAWYAAASIGAIGL